jgi:uncharacterized caspase-like protein
MLKAIGFALLAVGLAAAPARAANIWALVIGVDDYQNVNKLDGAVNDARDIQNSIQKLGAKEIVFLKNGEADRATILAKWQELAGKAQDGDTLIVSFAGHGAQVQDESGQTHRFVALAGFDMQGKPDAVPEALFDADFGKLFRAEKNLTVIFVVDACHAGTMTRGYKSTTVKTRSLGEVGRSGALDKMTRSIEGKSDDEGVVLPNVVHLGAVRTDELVPEISIDGQQRGALSYAFARALEGAADANHDGVISNEELINYLTGVVTQRSEGRQHPVLAVPAQWSLPMRGMTVTPAPHIAPQTVSVAITDAGALEPDAIAKALRNVQLAPKDQALMVWDVGTGQITNALGDVLSTVPVPTRGFSRVAEGADSAGPLSPALLGAVQQVIDKSMLVEAIKTDNAAHPLIIKLSPDDKVHTTGTTLDFQIPAQTYANLTLFDLASDGTVQFLYPLNTADHRDDLAIESGKPYSLPLKVSPPFGADNLVAILSAEPLTALHAVLQDADGKPATQLGAKLSAALSGKSYQIGIYPSFTAEK